MVRGLLVAGLFGLFLSASWSPKGHLATSTVLITEVYYDTPGVDGDEEWVEIANVGEVSLDLTDYKIGDEELMGQREGMVRFPEGTSLDSGEVLVIAQSATGFRRLYGRAPDLEIRDTEESVPEMERYAVWATGDVALANDGDEVLLVGPDNVIRDAVNYGDSTSFFAPAVAAVPRGQSIARVPAVCDSDSAADWQPARLPTPGTVTVEGVCAAPPDPAAGLTLLSIGAIQGAGAVSPYVNQVVSFRGVVTGSYEDRNTRGITFYTLFVQEPPGQEDGDPVTSDGIGVFLGRTRPGVEIGEEVLVTGQVTEFYGFTEIADDGLRLQPTGSAGLLPEPVRLDRQPDVHPDYEALEGMLVSMPEAGVIGPTHIGCGFAVVPPPAAASPIVGHLAQKRPEILPLLHNSDVDCTGLPAVKVGDRVTGLEGPLIYHFDQYKLVHQSLSELKVTPAPLPPLPTPPAHSAERFAVATFNLHEHFDSIRENGPAGAPQPADGEVALKREKLGRAIVDFLGCPAILGVQEVENAALLEELARALKEPCGFQYQVSHRESADARGIDVALLSDPVLVRVKAVELAQACSLLQTGIVDAMVACPPGQEPLFSRPPLRVMAEIDGEPYVLFVNHLKSKREGEAETAPRRLAQAAHLNRLVEEILAREPEGRVIVMGDFNDEPRAATLQSLDRNLDNPLLQLPGDEQYSYIFGGIAQLLDGILLSPAATKDVVGSAIVHINAAFPYTWAGDTATPLRASDHDIPIVLMRRPGVALATILEPEPTETHMPGPSPAAGWTPTAMPTVVVSPEAALDAGGAAAEGRSWLPYAALLFLPAALALGLLLRRK